MFETRISWAVRIASLAAALFILWESPLLVPLRVLIIFFHEIFHATAVFLTGGGANSIEITLYKTGLTSLYGGIPAVVYSAGYIGTALLGSILIISTHRHPFKRPLYLVLGTILLLETILFARNPFGLAYGWTAGLFFLTLVFKDFRFADFITELVGIMCVVDALRDLVSFYWQRSGNDASILHRLTGVPYDFIVTTWILVSITLVGLAIAFTLKSISSANIEELLLMYKPDFITRRFYNQKGTIMKNSPESIQKRGRVTLGIYISVIVAIILLIMIASRFILFHPWTAREWISAAIVNDYIYAVGGRDKEGQIYDQIQRISVKNRKMKEVARLPSPRFGVVTAGVGEKLYIIGGFDGRECYDDILVFNTRRKEMRKEGNLPEPRAFGGVSVISGDIYYLGGWSGEDQVDEIYRINTVIGEVVSIGQLPTPREFVSATAAGNRIYLIGGSDYRGQYLDEVLEIDPQNGDVLRTAGLPSPRTRVGAVSYDAAVYLVGGWDGNKLTEILTMTPSVEKLSVQVLSTLSRGYSDASLVALHGALYLIGGTHEQFQRQLSVVEIDPVTGDNRSLKFRSFLFW
jgi:hypothetical protein